MARIKAVSPEDRLTLVEHLDELRTRIIVSLAVFGVALATAIYDPRKGAARSVLRPLFALEVGCLGGFVVA